MTVDESNSAAASMSTQPQAKVVETVNVPPFSASTSYGDIVEALDKLTRSVDRLSLQLQTTHPVIQCNHRHVSKSDNSSHEGQMPGIQVSMQIPVILNESGYRSGDVVCVKTDGRKGRIRKATRCYVWLQIPGNIFWVKKHNSSVAKT